MIRPVEPYHHLIAEKRVYTVKFSIGETLYRALQDLAASRNRSLSDYCHHRLLLDSYGEVTQARRQADSLDESDPE